MYNQNSNRDLYLSQSWSQLDSQDWNSQIPSSQDLGHHVPSTPSARVLPPTPSTSGMHNSNLSNSWSSRSNTQMSSHPLSQNQSSGRGVVKESIFSKEIRFALHAVVSVVKDLPNKLRDIVKSSENRGSLNEILFKNVKKILDEKMKDLNKILSVAESGEGFMEDSKKSREGMQSGMEEIQRTLCTHSSEVTNLQSNLDQKTANIKKHIVMLRKLYVNESRKLHTLLIDLKRSDSEKEGSEANLEATLKELQVLTKASRDCNEDLFRLLKEKGDRELEALNVVSKEVALIKAFLHDLPPLITSSVRSALNENRSTYKQNVRVASRPSVSPFERHHPILRCSPVARVLPQMKTTGPDQSSNKSATSYQSVLDVIDCESVCQGYTRGSSTVIKEESPESCSPSLLASLPKKTNLHSIITSMDKENKDECVARRRHRGSTYFPYDYRSSNAHTKRPQGSSQRDDVYINRPLSRPRSFI